MIGSTIGSYRITGLLGEGGMGAVYRATDNIEREVAIKALHSNLTRDESRLARFRSEAVALGRLHHPNIASLFHLHEQNGDYFMVMEFVEGQTLEDIVRAHGALSPQMALAVFNDGLKGFEHAHSKGVIHRDIKPSNLMVSREGTTKITDFGIARMAGSGRMTQTGKVIGTLEYMSPEQVRGHEQDARSDIYSLGILLFELLTGRMPFTATSDYDIMRAHLEEIPPPARSIVATLPPGLDAAVAKALAKDPAARFQSVNEMRGELESIARELPAAPPATKLVPEPTREVALPVTIPATSQGPVVPVTGQGQVSSAPQSFPPQAVPPHRPQVPLSRSTAPKWAIPVAASLAALVLFGGLLSARRSSGQGEPVPTPVPASQIASASNTSSDPQSTSGGGTSGGGGTTENQPSTSTSATSAPKVTTEIELPSSIPALDKIPLTPPEAGNAPAAPTPSPTRQRAVESSRPAAVVPRPPTPRRQERVVTAPRPRRQPVRERIVERPRPKPRIRAAVERPRPRPKPRVRETVVRRPAPRPRRPSGGGGEEAALRSILKGG